MRDLTNLKPNELIRLAINDMKLTLQQGYRIDMRYWGENIGTPNCSVCFAGSVMLQQGKEPLFDKTFNPHFADNHVESDINKIVYTALDSIRNGNLKDFCNYLHIELPYVKPFKVKITNFECEYVNGNEEEFYDKMEWVASLFD